MSYDDVGNLTLDTYTSALTAGMQYDADNKMTSAANGGHQYRYNADGKRVKRIITGTGSGQFWMVYGIGGELVAEYNATSSIPAVTSPSKEYGYRGGQMLIVAESSTVVKWLVQDHLGSTRMEIGVGGALSDVTRHDFLPFGEELAGSMRVGNGYGAATSTKQKFTGYEKDTETGLDFAQARYMSNIQGRFISVDPDGIGGAITEPQSWNGYSYVGNRPTTLTDPSGLLWAYNRKEGKLYWSDLTEEQWKAKYGNDKNWVILDGQLFVPTSSQGGFIAGQTYYLTPGLPFAIPRGRNIRPVALINGLGDSSYGPFFLTMIGLYTLPLSVGEATTFLGFVGNVAIEQATGQVINKGAEEIIGAFSEKITLKYENDRGTLLGTATFEDGKVVEFSATASVDGKTLTLDKVHLEGAKPGEIGITKLNQAAIQLGKEFGVETVVINGARRSTGLKIGKIPRPRILRIP